VRQAYSHRRTDAAEKCVRTANRVQFAKAGGEIACVAEHCCDAWARVRFRTLPLPSTLQSPILQQTIRYRKYDDPNEHCHTRLKMNLTRT